jgi:tripartite-type tricarboxylate transporter receptor subunit TctC
VISKRTMLKALLAAGAAPLAPAVHAQAFPSRPIRMIMPFAPGSPNDVVGRLIADGLSARLGQNVVVDNRPGAGTLLGTRAAAAAEPDGHTLLLNSSSLLVAPAMYKEPNFHPLNSFVAVANLVWASWLTVIAGAVPARDFAEFVAYTKAHPGKLIFAYTPGTAPQLVGEWLKVKTGMNVTSVAYRGGAQVMTDMMGGRIHLYIAPATTLLPFIEQGKFRPIAYWSAERSPQFPEVPTMIESGFPGLALGYWAGLLAPAGTPREAVERLNAEVNAVLRTPAVIERMAKLGLEGRPGSPQDFADFLAEQQPKWIDIVEVSGVKGE